MVHQKHFLKWQVGDIQYPSSYFLDPSLAISYKNHQISLAYFSHLEPLTLIFVTKRQESREEDWRYTTTGRGKLTAMQTLTQLTTKTRGSKNHFAPYRFSNSCLLNARVNLVATLHLITSQIVVYLMTFNYQTNAQHSCCEP